PGATLEQLAISRSRESHADETAARRTGEPEALASALARLSLSAERLPGEVEPATASLFIVNPFAGAEGIATWFSTHPPMRERIRRLREIGFRGQGSGFRQTLVTAGRH
ncbi:MAG: M48 family metalloprotease, partial [Acidobacteriota bacterium]